MTGVAVDVGVDSFQREVIDESRERPVVVDFWAEWCGPCRQLGPVLEQLASEAGGAWKLVKVDTDANPDLARRYGIQSIPAVKAFIDGKVADEFVGALPKGRIQEWIAGLRGDPADEVLGRLELALRQRDGVQARAAIAELEQLAPDHLGVRLGQVRLAVLEGDPQRGRTILASLDEAQRRRDPRGIARLELGLEVADQPDEAALRARAAQGDSEAAVALGNRLAVQQRWAEAFDTWLALVRTRSGDERAVARTAMVRGFEALGKGPLTDTYQRKLAMALY